MENVSSVRITNLDFGVINGKYNEKVRFFVPSNNDKIYSRLMKELGLKYLPYLGPKVLFGRGETCLEEDNGKFYYYVIDRGNRVFLRELPNIYEAIDYLVDRYTSYFREVDKSKMKDIMYEELNLEKSNRKTRFMI